MCHIQSRFYCRKFYARKYTHFINLSSSSVSQSKVVIKELQIDNITLHLVLVAFKIVNCFGSNSHCLDSVLVQIHIAWIL